MKYKKNKFRLNEMQSFYILIKFGLVLIYIWKVYRKKLFDFIEKKYFQIIICIFLFKNLYLLKFWKFLCWKYTNYSQHISLEIFFWNLFISNY